MPESNEVSSRFENSNTETNRASVDPQVEAAAAITLSELTDEDLGGFYLHAVHLRKPGQNLRILSQEHPWFAKVEHFYTAEGGTNIHTDIATATQNEMDRRRDKRQRTRYQSSV